MFLALALAPWFLVFASEYRCRLTELQWRVVKVYSILMKGELGGRCIAISKWQWNWFYFVDIACLLETINPFGIQGENACEKNSTNGEAKNYKSFFRRIFVHHCGRLGTGSRMLAVKASEEKGIKKPQTEIYFCLVGGTCCHVMCTYYGTWYHHGLTQDISRKLPVYSWQKLQISNL